MTLENLITFFGWSSVINYTMLLIWFIFFSLAHEWIYKLHNIWFKIPRQKFDDIHYLCMAIFKVIIFVFNITPYVVLKFLI